MNGGSGIDRRSFLVGAAAAGVAATGAKSARAAEATATGGSGDKATLKWGIIGTGTRGAYTHIPVLKEAPESQIVALCDIAEDRLNRAAGSVGHAVQTFKEYQKLIDSADVNAIVIAVPNLLHREVLDAAIKSGKHILCEKPAGANMADAAAMKKMVDGAKQVVMFGMQYRNSAKQRLIYETIQSGKIGKPKYLVQNCSRGDWNLSPNVWRYSDPKVLNGQPVNWRFSQTASGGTLNEFSCHYLDLLHGMVGALPTKISANGGIAVYKDGRDTWDYASVTMTYPDGVTAVHTLSLFGPGRSDVTIMGDEGFIEDREKLTLVTYGKTADNRGRPQRKQQELKPQEPEGHAADRATLALYQDFIECVKTGKKPEANIDRAVAASRTCWLAELASDRHTEVNWNDQTA